jgi:hypothetical protein
VDRYLLFGALAGGALLVPHFDMATAGPYAAGAIGLLAIHERLRWEFDGAVALTTTLLLFAGTSLFWAMTRGAIGPDILMFVAVAVALALAGRPSQSRGVAVAVWAGIAVIPVLARVLVSPADAAGASSAPWGWLPSLFSSSHGLFTLTPITYVAFVGTLVYVGRNALWTTGAVMAFSVWVISAAVMRPSPDAPFGHGLTSALVLFAPGLARLIELARARPVLALAPLVIAALAWNYWLMVQYTVGMLPKDAPVSFARMVREQATVHTRDPYVYPFAFPANVWFAWREQMPASRFESLAFEPRRASVDLVLDRAADRFLVDGWDAPGADDSGPARWTGGHRASVALPLEVEAGRPQHVVVTARARLDEPAVAARLALEINGYEVGRFSVPPDAPRDLVIRVPASPVGQPWRAGYNRLTLVSHGVERVDPADQRPPGPLARGAGNRAWPVAIYRIRITPAP